MTDPAVRSFYEGRTMTILQAAFYLGWKGDLRDTHPSRVVLESELLSRGTSGLTLDRGFEEQIVSEFERGCEARRVEAKKIRDRAKTSFS